MNNREKWSSKCVQQNTFKLWYLPLNRMFELMRENPWNIHTFDGLIFVDRHLSNWNEWNLKRCLSKIPVSSVFIMLLRESCYPESLQRFLTKIKRTDTYKPKFDSFSNLIHQIWTTCISKHYHTFPLFAEQTRKTHPERRRKPKTLNFMGWENLFSHWVNRAHRSICCGKCAYALGS